MSGVGPRSQPLDQRYHCVTCGLPEADAFDRMHSERRSGATYDDRCYGHEQTDDWKSRAQKAEAERADLLGRLERAEARLAMLSEASRTMVSCWRSGQPGRPHFVDEDRVSDAEDALSASDADVTAFVESLVAKGKAEAWREAIAAEAIMERRVEAVAAARAEGRAEGIADHRALLGISAEDEPAIVAERMRALLDRTPTATRVEGPQCKHAVCVACGATQMVTTPLGQSHAGRIAALARAEPDLPIESVVFQASLADREIDPPSPLPEAARVEVEAWALSLVAAYEAAVGIRTQRARDAFRHVGPPPFDRDLARALVRAAKEECYSIVAASGAHGEHERTAAQARAYAANSIADYPADLWDDLVDRTLAEAGRATR